MSNERKQETQPDQSGKHVQHQGIIRDGLGQDQPADKERAQHVSRKDKGGDPPGDKAQR
jgi:hypothetical protein